MSKVKKIVFKETNNTKQKIISVRRIICLAVDVLKLTSVRAKVKLGLTINFIFSFYFLYLSSNSSTHPVVMASVQIYEYLKIS